MASDYVREHPDYVRGTLEDSIINCSRFCHQCGETRELDVNGCHVYCRRCKSVSEGCGD
jgi:hypothetical protein